MKKQSNRSKGGRKKFSAGKQLGPDKTLQDNLDIAAIGEFALDPRSRAIFGIVALWQQWNTLPAAPPGERFARARDELQAKRKATANETLLALLRPALDILDPKPFETFVKAIQAVKYFSGPRAPAMFEVLRAVHQKAVEKGIEEPSLDAIETMTKAELRTALRREMDNHTLRDLAKIFDRRFKPGKGGRPRNPGGIPT